MLKALRKGGGRASLDDLETWVFGPWLSEYDRREESGREALWDPHLDRLRANSGTRTEPMDLLAAWFRPYGEQLIPTAEANQTLEALGRRGLKLAMVSNVPLPGKLYVEVLDRHRLAESLDRTYFSYDCGTRKPSPALLRRAMSGLRVDSASCVMVGDRRERDILAGRLAGAATVWLRSPDAGGPDADAILENLSALPELLDTWQG